MQKGDFDNHKLMYHPIEVGRWFSGEIVAPIYVEIGPIRACNHKCDFCAFDYIKKSGNMIPRDVMISTLKNMAEFGVKSIMFCGEGEPLLYPHICEAVQKAKEFGLDVAITSNGVLFTEDKARAILPNISWIKFSVDAGTPEEYARIHGTRPEDFQKLMDNIAFASRYKKENNLSCKIGCQMIITDDSIDDAENLIKKLDSIGPDYLVMKPYCIHPQSHNRKDLSLENYDEKLTRLSRQYTREGFSVIYRDVSFNEVEKSALDYDVCYGVNFISLIDASGNVLPCSVFYDNEQFYYGNINKNTFEEIWKSEQKKQVTEKVYKRGSRNCRNNCRLNFVNKYLYTIKNKTKLHMNFI